MISACGITDKGAVREQNQDVYEVRVGSEGYALGIVCDGMGGARGGHIASRLALDSFINSIYTQSTEMWLDQPGAILNTAAQAANEAVFARANADTDCHGMGTTMVAALVLQDVVYLLNIGDSRGYLISDQAIRRVTKDHSVVANLVATGKITEEEARQHPQKNLITRALGSETKVRADVYEFDVQQGDFLLLCTDGLSNIVSDQEILHEVCHSDTVNTCCNRLLALALSRGAPDNVTAVLLHIA